MLPRLLVSVRTQHDDVFANACGGAGRRRARDACRCPGGPAAVVERRRCQVGDRRLRRGGDHRWRTRIRAAGRAHRRLRQRRHAVGRATDLFPVRLRVRPGEGPGAAAPGMEGNPAVQGHPRGRPRGADGFRSEGSARDHRGDPRRHAHRRVLGDRRRLARDRRHPRFDRPYTELIYQPMLELLAWLRERGFKTFIVSGGGVEFMRVFAERVYGIPPEQVVGSSGVVKFEIGPDDKPVLLKEPEVEFVDDGPGKPVGINRFIGRRPIMVFGNSDGDLQMLQWTTAGDGPRFGLIVHHDDSKREWAYDRDSHIGRLGKALDAAPAWGWIVVSMKDDWRTIFAEEPR